VPASLCSIQLKEGGQPGGWWKGLGNAAVAKLYLKSGGQVTARRAF
jgi:hypothetical protein